MRKFESPIPSPHRTEKKVVAPGTALCPLGSCLLCDDLFALPFVAWGCPCEPCQACESTGLTHSLSKNIDCLIGAGQLSFVAWSLSAVFFLGKVLAFTILEPWDQVATTVLSRKEILEKEVGSWGLADLGADSDL